MSDACRLVHSTVELLKEVQQLLRFGITEIDVRTGAVTWSDELFRIFGWEPGEVTPGLEALLARVYPADVASVRHRFDRAGKVQLTSPIEFRIVHPDGELRTLQTRSRLILDEQGAPSRVVCTTIDVSEHKETAARLVFTDRMASVGTLAAGVAHEINNPLAFISAHLDLITDEFGESLPGDLGLMLGETRRGVDRIRNIVRGLQAFSRTDEDQRAPLDVARVLDLAVLMAGTEIRHRAELVRNDAPLPAVVANQATLGQVFLNLLVNATESIPEGQTDQHRITISTRTDESGWGIIEIRDTGRGIPREIQGQIFDPFFTTKPIGKGTGLGLSICHGIVRSIGGEIGFTSEPGAGAVFRVALPPALAPNRVLDVQPAVAVESQQAATAPRTTRVLIIDDEVVFANALRRLLSRDRHAITIVNDAKEAVVRAIAGERFDAILCDLMMPSMSGMEVHAQMMAIAPEQAARMIFLTGGAFSPSAKEFLARIPNTRFDKPCDLEALRAAILRITES
jgi:PAS domain S-box-containing protein